MLEFGPLWLVALAVPAFLYRPALGGPDVVARARRLLGGRGRLTRPEVADVVATAIVACCVVLALSHVACSSWPYRWCWILLVVEVTRRPTGYARLRGGQRGGA
jgi:hypothetical protein